MPYEGARTAVAIGLACAALGDRTAAALELDNARETFSELGAAPDLDRLDGSDRHGRAVRRRRPVRPRA